MEYETIYSVLRPVALITNGNRDRILSRIFALHLSLISNNTEIPRNRYAFGFRERLISRDGDEGVTCRRIVSLNNNIPINTNLFARTNSISRKILFNEETFTAFLSTFKFRDVSPSFAATCVSDPSKMVTRKSRDSSKKFTITQMELKWNFVRPSRFCVHPTSDVGNSPTEITRTSVAIPVVSLIPRLHAETMMMIARDLFLFFYLPLLLPFSSV